MKSQIKIESSGIATLALSPRSNLDLNLDPNLNLSPALPRGTRVAQQTPT
jgi:hypothetical protein